jgi:hypothetical protein
MIMPHGNEPIIPLKMFIGAVVVVTRTNKTKYIIQKASMRMFRVTVVIFNATFNNISAISWRSILLVEETRVPRENHWPATGH